MRIFNETPLLLAATACPRQPGAHHVTMVVKGTFALVPDGKARFAGEAQPFDGDRRWDDAGSIRYPSDFAPFKPRADAMLVGTFRPPKREKVTTGHAAFRVGRMHKSLAIAGDRRWIDGPLGVKASEPAALGPLPLRYEHAFGGPGFAANPTGKGAAKLADGWPLPNIERPERLVRSPEDRPEPAGFGPLDARWPGRAAKAGSYGGDWLAARWPYFPADFDWGYFNAAPADQQIDGYLRGDEAIAFEGLHPQRAVYESQLPALRPRCFLRRDDAPGPAFEEVSLSLDTLWIDADAELAVLVWRGTSAVRTRDFRDVSRALLAVEELARAALPAEHYLADAFWSKPGPTIEDLADIDENVARALKPEATPAPQPPVDAAAEEAEALAQARKMLVDGKAPAEVIASVAGATTFAAFMAALDAHLPKPDPNDEAKIAEHRAAGRKVWADQGNDPTLLDPPKPDEPAATPPARPSRDELAAKAAKGESLAGVDLENADLGGVDLHGADLAGAKLAGAKLGLANLSGADLTGACLRGAHARDARFDGAILVDADLERIDATGASFAAANLGRARLADAILREARFDLADFHRAVLDRADLQRTSLSSTSLADASLREARLSGAKGERALLRGADLTGADLAGAALTRANLSGATLDRAKLGASLPEVTLERAHGSAVTFAGADLTQARAGKGCSFPGGDFRGVRADGAIWIDADLSGAVFAEAALVRASFRGANLEGTSFHRARLRSADLTEARLGRAKLTQVDLFEAVLPRADLRGADCRDSNFYGCELWEATTAGARFDRTDLGRTKLAGKAP